MLLATLERLRAKTSMSTSANNASVGRDSGYRASTQSSDTNTDSVASRTSSKRYSNNLFGSGRFRDYSYIRSATKEQRHGSVRSGLSNSTASLSSSPQKGSSSEGGSSSTTVRGNDDELTDSGEVTLQRTLSKSGINIRRASMALDEVIREIEEESEAMDASGDDQVLVPRSPVDGRVVCNLSVSYEEAAHMFRSDPILQFRALDQARVQVTLRLELRSPRTILSQT